MIKEILNKEVLEAFPKKNLAIRKSKKGDNMREKRINIFTLFVLVCLLAGFSFAAQENIRPIKNWLVLGPGPAPGNEDLILSAPHMNMNKLKPILGQKVLWSKNKNLTWRALEDLSFTSKKQSILYIAVYLESFRFLKGTFQLETGREDVGVEIYFDGKVLSGKKSGKTTTVPLELLNQKHLLLVKAILPAGANLKLIPSISMPKDFAGARLQASLVPDHRVSVANILNTIQVKRISLSPDGKLAVLSMAKTFEGSGDQEKWTEVISAQTGKTLYSTRGSGSLADIQWLKHSKSFSHVVQKEGKASIYIFNLNNYSQTPVLEGVNDFSEYWWSPDNSYLVYSKFHSEKNKKGYKLIKKISDRPQNSGGVSSMNIYFPKGGITHRISGKEKDFSNAVISPDSSTILLIGYKVDRKNRPYNLTYASTFSVGNFKTRELIKSNFVNDFYWSPDSRQILMLGGPSSFDGLGKNLTSHVIPNDYDVQAYIYDLATPGKPRAISKNFNPSIDGASWDWNLNQIFFNTTDKSEKSLYKYSVKKRTFTPIKSPVDSMGSMAFAARAGVALSWGSGAGNPHKLYRVNLASGRVSLLRDFNKEMFTRVKIGQVKPWDFKTPEGRNITGRIHYPVDFNPAQKYPCIVYYYGGTSPVGRSFGGRYPFNWYTAHGYIVYVLQPSGSIGFGQDISAEHVNDWGKITSREVIMGVEKLLAAHPYIDRKALGAMGASYGGFLTQYLSTQTDIFAAYISHAGISDITSYWGEGEWGYSYSGIATAGSFPWNRKDIYVGHSPLFMADRVSAPMLLLHGSIDNNVPPGESYQMFAALKLLGKEVSLVTFDNQYHFIMDYPKRIQWMKTIMAWWDKHLKKQPQYWQSLYPEDSPK